MMLNRQSYLNHVKKVNKWVLFTGLGRFFFSVSFYESQKISIESERNKKEKERERERE